MFGLFKRNDSIDWQTLVQTALSQCQLDVFAHGLVLEREQISVSESSNQLNVTLRLPMAVQSVAPLLAEYLQDALKKHGHMQAITVTLQTELKTQPVFKQIKQIILVASGKGGVGKSTTAVNLAVGLAQEGAAVGLLDADIYGPSMPLMLGLANHQALSHDNKTMEPARAYGVLVNSIGFLVPPEQASIWRGPMASQALTQLLRETHWPELDYLVIDLPPGTGDIQLTLSQLVPASGAVVVTTPQNVALADANKAIAMFNKVNLPVLGVVENMSYFQCEHCGGISHIFGCDGGAKMAKTKHVPLLAQVPLRTEIQQLSDAGTPVAAQAGHPLQPLYLALARQVSYQLALRVPTASIEISMTDE